MNRHYKGIVVGQGIAGTLISYALLDKGQSICVIDSPQDYGASKAAAGLINPITGRYFTKSWMIDDLLPQAVSTYEALGALLGHQFWYPADIYRTLPSIKQYNDWSARLIQEPYQSYAREVHDYGPYTEMVNQDEGVALIKQGGRVEVNALLGSYQEYLQSKNSYMAEKFEHNRLSVEEDRVSYGEITADYIIFAEGVGVLENPYFKDVPLQPAKGEALHVKLDGITDNDTILKHQQYLVPMVDDNMYWSGGGFAWKYESCDTTEEFRMSQVSDLESFLNIDVKVQHHVSGVRPCVKDRKPLIGRHDDYRHLYLFNGLGTKGTSLAPYFAEMLAEHILNQQVIIQEVNVSRYYQT